jgi:glycosyltransferase involved in cell wall biosynthesis
MLRIASLLNESSGPTILHTHFARWDIPATLVARLPRPARRADPVVVIWHRHGTLGGRSTHRGRDVLRFKVVGRGVDAHLCVGPAGYHDVLARGTPPRRTMLFPNGLRVERFPLASGEERARARAELGISRLATVLVAFVWDWERKGGQLLLELVHELEGTKPVLALLVGAGQEGEAAARRLGVDGSIRRVPARPDPRAFFCAADVFAAPSAHEGLGFAPLEAVCCGTPVVASDVPGHRHFGIHLPAFRLSALSAIAMADAVKEELSSSPEDRMRRIEASRAYLAQHAGLDCWVHRLIHVYEQALRRRGSVHQMPAFAASSS